MKKQSLITLNQFIIDEQSKFPYVAGSLSRIFRDIQLAAKLINRDVRKAGLVDILGDFGNKNIQGEDQKKLDVISNEIFIKLLEISGDCLCVVSEELDEVHWFENAKTAKYFVAIDPLDGSSNIDVNASIGSIFSIYKSPKKDGKITTEDLFVKGSEQVAAGYVIYGASTMFVYTTGSGVFGFTLDDSIQEFCLSHENIKIPEDGKIYSMNEGNLNQCNHRVKKYVDDCKANTLTARYIGSLIADFHRNLLKGGIYIYPATEKDKNGKLRLLYECFPMAMLIEQAGGMAFNDTERILDITPSDLHQRSVLYVGSKNMVEKLLNG